MKKLIQAHLLLTEDLIAEAKTTELPDTQAWREYTTCLLAMQFQAHNILAILNREAFTPFS